MTDGIPVPLQLLLGMVGLAGTLGAAGFAAFSKKWRTPADDREDRKLGIEVDDRLLERFHKLMADQDKRIDSLVEEIKEVRVIAEKAVAVNRVLIDWCYAAIRVVRELGGIHLLPSPPEGVVIADHPSNQHTRKE